MIKSMTGFGKATCETENKRITIEIKSLNSKLLDLNVRIPGIYKEKELELRNEVARQLERGKIDISIYAELTSNENNTVINKDIVKDYYRQLVSLYSELGLVMQGDPMATILRFPDALKTEREEVDEEEWSLIFLEIRRALGDLDKFRMQEGNAMKVDITKRIDLIQKYLDEVDEFEKDRIDKIKHRIELNLEEFVDEDKYDKNRLEQEMIYFLEKIDITEEKVRLANHCIYFLETLETSDKAGKKLGFITQEIGREINTIGSKANDSKIQHIVVQMKDELEKIKEQLLNVL